VLKMKNLFTNNSLLTNFKKYKLAFISSFSVGFLIASIPYIYRSINDYKIDKLIEKERLLQIQIKEKKCKENGTDYNKFLNLGFPNTAIEKFKICMEGQ